MSTAALTSANARRWNAMRFNTSRIHEFQDVSVRLLLAPAKTMYQEISKGTGVPWGVVAVIHERESSANFNTQLAQGDPLGSVSVHEPRGEGPYHDHDGHSAFYWAALIALERTGGTTWHDWSPGGTMTFLELKYNGPAYANAGRPSPYIWSGSDQYTIGKVEVDHGPIMPVVDQQLGCAPLLRYMSGLDPSVGYGPPNSQPQPKEPPVATPAISIDLGSILKSLGPLAPQLAKLALPGLKLAFPQFAPFITIAEGGYAIYAEYEASDKSLATLEKLAAKELRAIADALDPPVILTHEAATVGATQNAVN